MSHVGFKGVDVNETAAMASIPSSVNMFVNVLLGGQKHVDQEFDEVAKNEIDAIKKARVCSIGQDMVYGVCGDKKAPPKHVGLGLTLHQATRSKKLVNLFHNAGHIVSYSKVLQYDTAMAEATLKHLDPQTGTVVPQNLVVGRFVHFSGDNLDINDSTLDGKNTFHGTQLAAWQRGPPAEDTTNALARIEPSKSVTLKVPAALEKIHGAKFIRGSTSPYFGDVEMNWFSRTECDTDVLESSHAQDMSFLMARQGVEQRPSWTSFNQSHCNTRSPDPPRTTVGYMPIILAPAHEMSTLNTLVLRALHVSRALGNNYTVVTVDQGLFPQLMELKWVVPEFKDALIPRLGGLHISMNFLKVIGQHTEDIGLAEMWTESGLLGPNTAGKVKDGKSYAKAVRAHKLTWQALWQLLMPQFRRYLEEKDRETCEALTKATETKDHDTLLAITSSFGFRQHVVAFAETKQSDKNFTYWWNYMGMVSVLLGFIRAQREGIWELHLATFREMLPFFHRYDHTNYARWGCVYLSQMKQLPQEVADEFRQGNFVVKGSNHRFNQVSPDHSLEWLNGVGKKSGGIVGITKTNTALARWTLSYNQRASVSNQTYEMMNVGLDTEWTPNEATPARMSRDNKDEGSICNVLRRFKVMADETADRPDALLNIATRDVATADVDESLLNAEQLGQNQLETFVKERMVDEKLNFRDPLPKAKALTFASLYDVQVASNTSKGKMETLKADRNFTQRLIMAYRAGRPVDLNNILNHELMKVPVSIADTSGTLRTGTKSILFDVLTKDVSCPSEITISEPSCLIIDGQAMIMSLGKPSDVNTFGEYADVVLKYIFKQGEAYDRIDVTFDRYRDLSIKADTRVKRTKKSRPIRRLIEDKDVPLPNKWTDFLASTDNKRDLCLFLSNALIATAPSEKTVVVSGGFASETEVQSTDANMNTDLLESTHEEADTRIILHCIHSNAQTIVVTARDTDILILLLAHFNKLTCSQLWLKAGTSKMPKYVPIHDIRKQLGLSDQVYETIPAFHAITGCDTVSYFSGHSKKSAWDVFIEHNHLVKDLGRSSTLSKDVSDDAEKFICHIYKSSSQNCDQARVKLFGKCNAPHSMPPSSDAAQYHIQRANYQSLVWREACHPKPVIPSPTESG